MVLSLCVFVVCMPLVGQCSYPGEGVGCGHRICLLACSPMVAMESQDKRPVGVQAATFPPQSIERMLHVAAFAVSSYSGTNNRTLKPFNPLLGETFEFQYPEEGWRGIAEKVPSSLPSAPAPRLAVLFHALVCRNSWCCCCGAFFDKAVLLHATGKTVPMFVRFQSNLYGAVKSTNRHDCHSLFYVSQEKAG